MKAHGEGVDAGTARDQQARTGLVAGEMGETEQARPKADGYRHLPSEHGLAG
jgi:hypothetical protein